MEPESSAPVVLEELLRQAEQVGASDVHLQRQVDGAEVAFRLDGVLTPVRRLDGKTADRVLGRIKFLAHLKTYQEALPQDGRIDHGEIGTRNDLRVATYPTVTGEKVVLRLFQTTDTPDLGGLGFPSQLRDELAAFLARPTGLLLLTGPAGSGKTTTIYACLRQLADVGGRHVITVEDPAERILPGIMQTEVNEARGLTFAVAARHLLRQDPQVLVIGEIRDPETAGVAVRAALTGHLVISTLHAGSCRGVVERLLGLCDDRQAVFSALEMILNQRLVRQPCRDCAGRGCERCLQTGYRGRTPVVEWVRLDGAARDRLRADGPAAVKPGHTLAQSMRDILAVGRSNTGEALRILGDWPVDQLGEEDS